MLCPLKGHILIFEEIVQALKFFRRYGKRTLLHHRLPKNHETGGKLQYFGQKKLYDG